MEGDSQAANTANSNRDYNNNSNNNDNSGHVRIRVVLDLVDMKARRRGSRGGDCLTASFGGAVVPVPEVTKAWDDVLAVVQALVDRGGDDCHLHQQTRAQSAGGSTCGNKENKCTQQEQTMKGMERGETKRHISTGSR